MEYERDAFISHSSENLLSAEQIKKTLEDNELKIWLDVSNIRYGFLLRSELQSAIQNSRVLILLWSRPASKSRYVSSELLLAFHLDKFIIPCVLDNTELPRFLKNDVYIDMRQIKRNALDTLYRATLDAPNTANQFPPVIRGENPQLTKTIQYIAAGQTKEMTDLGNWNIDAAKKVHTQVDKMMQKAEKDWSWDPMIQNLAAYHRKNAYMLKYWDRIQGGDPPKEDPLLMEAERFFFHTLFVNPIDYSSLNGLGSILFFERELDAAEFFCRRAIILAKNLSGENYSEAIHDLQMIQHYKRAINLKR